ncbi:MAG: hypothetical protein Q4E57_08430 [Eubacteriales bacterium]|nr:hypothetical protein [Eubacteriales bacterium]
MLTYTCRDCGHIFNTFSAKIRPMRCEACLSHRLRKSSSSENDEYWSYQFDNNPEAFVRLLKNIV